MVVRKKRGGETREGKIIIRDNFACSLFIGMWPWGDFGTFWNRIKHFSIMKLSSLETIRIIK